MSKEISAKSLNKFHKHLEKQPHLLLVQNSVIANGIVESSINNEKYQSLADVYSTNVDSGLITNQKRSGRCWMFAAMNVLRLKVMEKLNIANMELSQSFPLFYDKLEKANFFLENILKTVKKPVGSRLLDFLLKSPVQDGGQWTMIVNLIKKYGVCPKDVYGESASSSNTQALDKYMTLKLREDALKLRTAFSQGKTMKELRAMKETMLEEIYRMLVVSLGLPPQTFTYEYVDKNNKYHRIENVTPQQFFNDYVGVNLDDYVSILNCPSPTRPLNHSITVKFLNNVEGGEKVIYLNLDIERMKQLCARQLQDGEVVWFGCDVGQFSLRDKGLMSTEMIEVDKLFNVSFNMSKGERVDYGESLMTHAMVLTGVNLDSNQKANRWRVENSWGDQVGFKGYFVMSDQWFDNFVYQAVINKKYLTAEELQWLSEKPIELEPWDPMGSLA